MRALRRLAPPGAVAALLLLLAACGDTPTAPMPSVNVAGNWSGTWTYSAAGVTVTDDISMSLNQAGSTVTGSWTAASGAAGQINFSAAASVSGSLTISQPLLGSSSCNATTTIGGSATANRLELTLSDIPPQGVCQWGGNSRFVLTR